MKFTPPRGFKLHSNLPPQQVQNIAGILCLLKDFVLLALPTGEPRHLHGLGTQQPSCGVMFLGSFRSPSVVPTCVSLGSTVGAGFLQWHPKTAKSDPQSFPGGRCPQGGNDHCLVGSSLRKCASLFGILVDPVLFAATVFRWVWKYNFVMYPFLP